MSSEELKKAIKDTIPKYKKIIFRADGPIRIKCLHELRKQIILDEKMYDQKLIYDRVRKLTWDESPKNIVIDRDMMRDISTGEVLCPDVDNTHWKESIL